MSIIDKIQIFLGIDKIIDAWTRRTKEKNKRRDIEHIRHNKVLAYDMKMMNLNRPVKICEERAKIIEETMDKDNGEKKSYC